MIYSVVGTLRIIKKNKVINEQKMLLQYSSISEGN